MLFSRKTEMVKLYNNMGLFNNGLWEGLFQWYS